MKKFLVAFLMLIFTTGSVGGYLFLKNEQKKMFDIYFNNQPINVLNFDELEFWHFHTTFYQSLNINLSLEDLKKYNICLLKNEIFKQNKKVFTFDQKQLESTLNSHCEKGKVFFNNEEHFINLYNICNNNKKCQKIILCFDDVCLFENKQAYQLNGNTFQKIDTDTFLNEKLNIQDTQNILFTFIANIGIGNQLFQHWGGYVYAQKKGLTMFPIRKKEIHDIFTFEQPSEMLNKIKKIGLEFKYYHRLIDFNEDLFAFTLNPISIKNFIGYEKFIQENTKFKEPLSGKSKKIAEQMKNETSVSIHIRRGDFKTDLYNILLNQSYYKKAIQYMKEKFENPHFYVFSNDIKWAKENLKPDANITFVDWTTKDYEDLHLMTKTKHNIIANSSFSWWGAFLNKNKDKIVLIPERGFYNVGFEHMKVDDNWIVIKE